MDTNITWHTASVSKDERRVKNGHHSFVIWFTGLSASGKSTVANAVARKLFEKNIGNYVLDGDNIRHGLNKDLGFSESDRMENIRRIGEVICRPRSSCPYSIYFTISSRPQTSKRFISGR